MMSTGLEPHESEEQQSLNRTAVNHARANPKQVRADQPLTKLFPFEKETTAEKAFDPSELQVRSSDLKEKLHE